MTFCIGIKVSQGLIALADTKIVKGEEHLTRAKIASARIDGNQWWLMTSGLRSVRDKVVTYLEQELAKPEMPVEHLFELANQFGDQLRRVRLEDGPSLALSNLAFNLHGILGGQLAGDPQPKMYYIYPEGNWIESTDDSPYFVIGRTHYAKPILDRLLTGETPLPQATALAFLAFDATATSVTDVGYPLDVLVCDARSRSTHQHRYEAVDLDAVSKWWHQTLANAINEFPLEYFGPLFQFVSASSSEDTHG
jgi:putative proteasome-type protease